MYLSRLSIRNFALVESVEIEFEPDIIAVTGETGAGKSMILGSIQLLLGERADLSLIRKGAERAVVEGMFEVRDMAKGSKHASYLREMGVDIDDDEPLIIRREITATGRSYAQVAGRMVTVKQLSQIAANLVDIHSQNSQQSLVKRSWQRLALDQFGDTKKLADKVNQSFWAWSKVQEELEHWRSCERDLRRSEDLLRFQFEEISQANISETDSLLEERENVLANAGEIASCGSTMMDLMEDNDQSILTNLRQLLRQLNKLEELDKSTSEMGAIANDLVVQATELSQEINSYCDQVEINPTELEAVQNRLSILDNLKKKYGDSLDEVMAYGAKIEKELEQIGSYEDHLSELKAQVDKKYAKLRTLADKLTAKRQVAAKKLAKLVEKELAYLGMEGTHFEITLEKLAAIQSHGAENINIQIAANPGEDLKPISKVASGGELSRITLALKCITTGNDDIQILLFDEIDSGISANIANAVGERLQSLGKEHQVFVITHMPNIAARGQVQFTVSKLVKDGRTRVNMKKLNLSERQEELARMLGGKSDMTMAHAHDLLIN